MQNKRDAIDEVAELRELVEVANYEEACEKELEILASFALYVKHILNSITNDERMSQHITSEPIFNGIKNISDMADVVVDMNYINFPREIIKVDSVKRKF